MWKTEYRCVNCKVPMTFSCMMNSHGRCPGCGYKGSKAGTIVDVTAHAYKKFFIGKWYLPWTWNKRKRAYQ